MPEYLSAAFANTWAITKVMYLVFAGGLLLERIAPAERGQPFRHLFFNFWYTPLFFFLTALALPPLQAITAPWIAAHGGWVPIRLPDTALGAVALGLAYMAVYDFFYY